MDEACQSALLCEGILLIANSHNYHCYICEKNISGIKCGIDHLKGRPHITKLKQFEELYEKRNGIVICKICKFEGSWLMYPIHKTFHDSLKQNTNSTSRSNLGINSNAIGNKKPNDLYKTFILNYISKHKEEYFCNLCHRIFSSWIHAHQHVETELHKTSIAKIVSTFSSDITMRELNVLTVTKIRELIENYIFPLKPNKYKCLICVKFVSGINNLIEHIQGSNHITCKLTKKFKDNVTGQIFPNIQAITNAEELSSKTQLKIPDHLKWMLTAHGVQVMETELYCHACNVAMNNNSAVESHLTSHLRMVWTKFQDPSLDSQIYLPNLKTTNQLKNEKPTNLIRHICNLCDVRVPYEKILIDHFLGRRHRKYMVELFGTIESLDKTKSDNETKENINVMENVSYFCPACNLQVNNVEALLNIDHNPKKKKGHTWLVIPGKNAIAKAAAKNAQGAASSLEMDFETSKEELSSIQSTITRKRRKPKRLNSSNSVASGSVTEKSSSPKDFVFTKNYIFDIDAKKLRILKLSIQLSYVIDREKMYCLICEVPNQLQNYYEHMCSIDHIENLAQMEKDNKEFEDYTDQFSDLSLAKEFMQELDDKKVKCFTCNVEILNEDLKIFEHITLESHDLKRQQWNALSDAIFEGILSDSRSTWYNVMDYECKLCNVKYSSEFDFGKHLDDKIHSQNSLSYVSTKPGVLMYDSCIPCGLLWFGSTFSYASHCKEMMHKYKTKNNRYIIRELPDSVKSMLQNCNEIINDLIKLSNEIRIFEEQKETALLKDLERTVKLQIPTAKAYIVGSRAANLYSVRSNIDVYIDCGNMHCEEKCSNAQLQSFMKTLKQCLSSNEAVWLIESVMESANPPYIKLEHRPSKLICNLTFASALNVVSTDVIKCFNNKYPTCRKLIIFLKELISACDLLGSSYISSYMITWLLIFYLQNRLIFPSIAHLIEIKNASRIIQGWETGVSSDFSINPSKLSFRELLIDFFQFYADLDYRNQVICPLLGTLIEKRVFEDPSKLPKHMRPYIDGVATGNNPCFRTDVPMCIQDPFLLSDNIAVQTKKLTLNRFRQLCTKSANFLNSI